MRVTDFLDRGAERFPERHVVHDGEQGITYRDFTDMTHRIANAILAASLGAGTRIAIYSPNHALGFAAIFGVARSGAAYIPLNVRNSADENVAVLDMLEADWIFFHSSLGGDVVRFRNECPRLRGAVCLDTLSEVGHRLEDWIQGQPDKAPDVCGAVDDVYAVFTTSGTTGKPKGVMLTHRNFECMAASFNSSLRFDGPPAHLVVAPLTHVAGVYAVSMLAAGGTHYILPMPTPASILQWIERYRISTLFLPPTLIYMMLTHAEVRQYNYSSLRYLCYGGAPMSADKLKEAIAIFGPVFLQVYGQTEAIVPVTLMLPHEHVEALADPAKGSRLLSCGRAGPFARVAVMNDAGELLATGEAGEVVVRGSVVMKGYYKNQEADAEVSIAGWHRTGDIGRIDSEGYLYLIDRKKDLIITGGMNVYPGEIEQLIWQHPSVLDCAVIGVPDDKWGEAVTAVVELKPGASLDTAELIALCKKRLGSVKAPKSVHIWATLPRSPLGKVLKREIRDQFWQGCARAI